MTTFAQLYPAEAADRDCLDPGLAQAVLDNGRWHRLVILGDSVAAGVRDPLEGYRDLSAGERLAEALAATRPEFTHRMLAQPFLRTAEIREKFLSDALAFEPDLVVVSAGGNDAFSRGFDAERFTAELDALLRPLASTGATVATIGLYDWAHSGLLPAETATETALRLDEVDSVQRHVVEGVGGIHLGARRIAAGRDPAIYSADRIHANARGQAIAFANVVRHLSAYRAVPDWLR